MKHISTAILLLLLSSHSFAGDFDKGVEAYEAEDYATALKEWKPLPDPSRCLQQHHGP